MSSEASQPVSLLIAYPYFTDGNIELLKRLGHSRYRLIVDSGAFSAWNSGKTIHLDEYCRFLDKIECLRPFYAVQLDVFGDPEASYKNFLIMRERGYDVMPVFTRGDSLEQLDKYYEDTDYIMFGGIVIGGANQNYVKWFLNRNKNRKCHWLGFVNMPFIRAYRPESVDSSSWQGTARFGALQLYTGFGSIKTVDKTVFLERPSSEIQDAMLRIGMGEQEMRCLASVVAWSRPWNFNGLDWSKPVHGMAQFVTTCSHLVRSYEVERKLGTKIYLAGNMERHNATMFYAQEFLKRKGIWR